jgi:hypothetical protein
MKQMNTFVHEGTDARVGELQDDHSQYWKSRSQVVAAAVDALAELMKRLDDAAARAAEDDVADLFREVAHRMPGRLAHAKIGWARLSDGRPALIVDDAWFIARDGNEELMAARKDGRQMGRIARGTIEPIAAVAVEGDVRLLQEPAETGLA